MPSTARASDIVPLDLDHLARMTGGEKALEREVLELFLTQTGRIMATLADDPARAATLSHTLKGSARAIGAFRVADNAAALETAAGAGGDTDQALADLKQAVTEARDVIAARLRRS
jgi:HPt (histidine-containing phosphotransfer) domain-containing protein